MCFFRCAVRFSRNRAPFSTFLFFQNQTTAQQNAAERGTENKSAAEIRKEKREKKYTLGRIDLRDDNRVDKSHIFLLRGQ